MAVIKMGTIVTGIRGTVGGLTFSANKSGPYARTWARGANPRSNLQSDARTNFAQLSGMWKTLSSADQETWEDFAAAPEQVRQNAFGEDYYISGFAWFLALSIQLDNADRAWISTAPVLPKPDTPTISAVTVSAGVEDCTIEFDEGTFDPDYDCVIGTVLGQSIGALSLPAPVVYTASYQTPLHPSLNFTDALFARWGNPQVGQRAFIAIVRQSLEGYRSLPAFFIADVIP